MGSDYFNSFEEDFSVTSPLKGAPVSHKLWFRMNKYAKMF
jgi:hypothetical protein